MGVEPELVRIGKFKSAGDQLLRTDMSVCAWSHRTCLDLRNSMRDKQGWHIVPIFPTLNREKVILNLGHCTDL